MPNALVLPYKAGVRSGDTLLPLRDPRYAAAARARYRRDTHPLLAYANSLYVPSGLGPTKGWLLVAKGDLDGLDLYANDFELRLDDFKNGPLSLKGLSICRCDNVGAGVASAGSATYLVEVTDARGVLHNPDFSFPTTSQYNVPAPAYPGDHYSATTNGGSAWTWTQMIGDLWAQMPLLGAYPGLGFSPASVPENFCLPGEPAWPALCRMLDLIGCVVTVDPTLTSPYGIAQIGAADAAYDAATLKYANLLEDDYGPIDSGSGRVPKELVIYFHRANQYYGSEETVRSDASQWSTTPLYSVVVAAPAVFSRAVGRGYLWDDFVVRHDEDGTPLPGDVTTAGTIAAERATQWYARVYRGTLGRLHRIYGGALPFKAGSSLDMVVWRQDFARGVREGWRTEVYRGDQPLPGGS